MADEFCLKMPDFHVTFRDLLHAVNLRHGTNGFTSLPKEGVLRIFFALKNPTASAGLEPANLGTKGQHATSGPPKPLHGKIVNFTVTCSSAKPSSFLSSIRNKIPVTLWGTKTRRFGKTLTRSIITIRRTSRNRTDNEKPNYPLYSHY